MPSPFRDLGPCFVIWDPTGDNVDLNPTYGGVKWRDTVQMADIFEDGQGLTPVDAVKAGRIVELEVPMTRSSLTQLSKVIAGSVLSGTKLTVSNTAGGAVLASAKEIILKPTDDNVASATTTEWTHFFRCYPVVDQEVVFDNSTERVTKILFKVYPDDTSGNVGAMYRYGPAS